jgi:hypothetical protein
MTTVINTPGNRNNDDNSSGWAVAVIILIVVIGIGAYFWFNYRNVELVTPVTNESTNINVTLPESPKTNSTTTL